MAENPTIEELLNHQVDSFEESAAKFDIAINPLFQWVADQIEEAKLIKRNKSEFILPKTPIRKKRTRATQQRASAISKANESLDQEDFPPSTITRLTRQSTRIRNRGQTILFKSESNNGQSLEKHSESSEKCTKVESLAAPTKKAKAESITPQRSSEDVKFESVCVNLTGVIEPQSTALDQTFVLGEQNHVTRNSSLVKGSLKIENAEFGDFVKKSPNIEVSTKDGEVESLIAVCEPTLRVPKLTPRSQILESNPSESMVVPKSVMPAFNTLDNRRSVEQRQSSVCRIKVKKAINDIEHYLINSNEIDEDSVAKPTSLLPNDKSEENPGTSAEDRTSPAADKPLKPTNLTSKPSSTKLKGTFVSRLPRSAQKSGYVTGSSSSKGKATRSLISSAMAKSSSESQLISNISTATSFLPRSNSVKVFGTDETKANQLEKMKEKEIKIIEKQRKKDEMLRQKIEMTKKLREQKILRAQERRMAKEQKALELRMEMKNQQMSLTKKEQAREEKLKEMTLQKQQKNKLKLEAAEMRRKLDEEARMAKLLEQEEMQKEMSNKQLKKREQEVKERQAKLADSRKMHEEHVMLVAKEKEKMRKQYKLELLKREEEFKRKKMEMDFEKEAIRAELEKVKLREQLRSNPEKTKDLDKQIQEDLVFEAEINAVVEKHNANLKQKMSTAIKPKNTVLNSTFNKEYDTNEILRPIGGTGDKNHQNVLSDGIKKHNSVLTKNSPVRTVASNASNSTINKENTQSYPLPIPAIPALIKSNDVQNYDISNLKSDDDTDDETVPSKAIPDWARRSNLKVAILKQTYQPPNLNKLFGILETPDLAEIFPNNQRTRLKQRTSSAIWDSPLAKRL